jgi:hypothetical protein
MAGCPAVGANDICIPTVAEPSTEPTRQFAVGYVPPDYGTPGSEISLPVGPGSFDVSGGTIVVADPAHLRVILGALKRQRSGVTIQNWQEVGTAFPPARVRLNQNRLLIQEYEAASENDAVCTLVPVHCDDLGRQDRKGIDMDALRKLQTELVALRPSPKNPIADQESLAGWRYLGLDGTGNYYYLVNYLGTHAAEAGAFHFRKYSKDGRLLGESPSLPEDNDIRIRDRARVDSEDVCYWLSVSGTPIPKTTIHLWSPK